MDILLIHLWEYYFSSLSHFGFQLFTSFVVAVRDLFSNMGICWGAPANAKLAHASSNQFSATSSKEKHDSALFSMQTSLFSLNKSFMSSEGSTCTPVSNNLRSFNFNDLKNAAKNFRSDSLLGEGGFGRVFKGWIDENTFAPCKPGTGMVVAIKKLKGESFQGHREWLTEVNYLSQLHHGNLVKLIGYCSESQNRLLVYEFMPKGSLENHLFRKGVQPIAWATRMQIAIDVARGLSFLHDLGCNIIYRDLKASNILLDSEFNAKLSDFGLARDGPMGDNTHVSTRVVGTKGYAAPEYVATGHLTPKSDVYSFGVVLLELLTGRRAMDDEKAGPGEETLVDWAKPFLGENRRVMRIMDTRLGGQYSRKAAQAVGSTALRCLHTDSKYRPPMVEVLATLEELHMSKDVPTPRTPPQAKLEPPGNKNLSYHHKTVSATTKL